MIPRSNVGGAVILGSGSGQRTGVYGWAVFLVMIACLTLRSALGANASGQLPPAPTGLSAVAADTSIALSWTATPGATGYNLKLSRTSGSGYKTVATNLKSTSVRLQKLANGATYYCVVSAVSAAGEGPGSQEVSATPSADAAAAPVPQPSAGKWLTTQVGQPGKAGTAKDLGGGRWNLTGSGDVWDSADNFLFVYQRTSGEQTLICRVDSVQDVSEFAKTGLMFRDGTDSNAVHAGLFLTARRGIWFQIRTPAGTAVQGVTAKDGITAIPSSPVWLKLVKDGQSIRAFHAQGRAKPSQWIEIGVSNDVKLSGDYLAGLAVSSQGQNTLCSASLAEVALTPTR